MFVCRAAAARAHEKQRCWDVHLASGGGAGRPQTAAAAGGHLSDHLVAERLRNLVGVLLKGLSQWSHDRDWIKWLMLHLDQSFFGETPLWRQLPDLTLLNHSNYTKVNQREERACLQKIYCQSRRICRSQKVISILFRPNFREALDILKWFASKNGVKVPKNLKYLLHQHRIKQSFSQLQSLKVSTRNFENPT